MREKIQRLLTGIAIIVALVIAWKAFDEYCFVRETNGAMELLGKP